MRVQKSILSGIETLKSLITRFWVAVPLLALVYYASAVLGLQLRSASAGLTPIWPPSGIALAIFLVRGRRYWPVLVLGEFFVALTVHQPPLAGLLGGVAQVLEALLAVYLLSRRNVRADVPTAGSVLRFALLGALLPPLVSSSVGAAGLWALGHLSAESFLPGWLTWWLGDAIGILLLTPLLVHLASPDRGRGAGGAGFRLTLYLTGMLVVSLPLVLWGDALVDSLFFLLLPFVVIAAMLFRIAGAGASAVVLAVLVYGWRPLDAPDAAFLTAIRMAFVGTSAFTGYVVAGFMQERSVAERTLREIFDSAHEAMCVLDVRSGQVVQANAATLTMLGVDDPPLGRPLFSLIGSAPPHDEAEGRRWMAECRAGGAQTFEWPVRRPPEGDSWYEVVLKPARIRGRERLLFVARNIDERKAGEESLRQMQATVEHAKKMQAIGTLAGGIAHDFNNVLAGMMGYAELALSYHLPEGHVAAEDMRQIISAGHQAAGLVRQILTFSRASDVEPQILDAVPVTKEVAKLIVSSLPPTTRIEVEITASNTHVRSGPTHIHQILMNLVTNAAHALPPEGGRIDVGLAGRVIPGTEPPCPDGLTAGEYLEIRVRDTGSGMEPEVVEKVFEPYFTTKAPGEGTGLGLSVVHGIVEDLGGAISLESRPGEGTTVRVLLPVAPTTETAPRTEGDELPRGDEAILYVDDNPLLTDIVSRFLGELGYAVTTLQDGQRAADRFATGPEDFQLVVTDLWMPGLEGIDLCRVIRPLRPHLPIILTTGNPEKLTADRLAEIGVRTVIPKPIDLAELAILVRHALDRG